MNESVLGGESLSEGGGEVRPAPGVNGPTELPVDDVPDGSG